MNAQKIAAVTALKDALEANNSQRLTNQELRDRPRSVYLALTLRGITQAALSMTEETAFKAVLANFTSTCTPRDAQRRPLTNATNLTSYGDCTVRDVAVQRSARNMTGDISPTAMAIFAYIVAHNASAVPAGDAQLTRAVASGTLLRALRTASPRLAAVTNLTLYGAPKPLTLQLNSSALAAQLSAVAVGAVVALVSQPGVAIGMKRTGAGVPAALNLSAFSALALSTDQAGAELAQKTSPALALRAVKVTDLAPGFGAVRLAVAAADELKPLQISLSRAAASSRRAESACRLNKVRRAASTLSLTSMRIDVRECRYPPSCNGIDTIFGLIWVWMPDRQCAGPTKKRLRRHLSFRTLMHHHRRRGRRGRWRRRRATARRCRAAARSRARPTTARWRPTTPAPGSSR